MFKMSIFDMGEKLVGEHEMRSLKKQINKGLKRE